MFVSGSAVSLRRFNRLPRQRAAELLKSCLPVGRWVDALLDGRPYARVDDLLEVAREAAFPFSGAELEAALAGRQSPHFIAAARRGDSALEARVREQLADGLCTYRERFGRPFLVRTAGRLPAQILVQLWDRLGHDLDTEDRVLAQQLRELALRNLAGRVTG